MTTNAEMLRATETCTKAETLAQELALALLNLSNELPDGAINSVRFNWEHADARALALCRDEAHALLARPEVAVLLEVKP